MLHFDTIDKCKICGSTELTDVIKIEPQFLSPTFVEDNSENEISKIKIPLLELQNLSEEDEKDVDQSVAVTSRNDKSSVRSRPRRAAAIKGELNRRTAQDENDNN